jgi:hypothetical protein
MTERDDHAEISDLLARYAHLCDLRDVEGVGACFTEDGQATYSGRRLAPGRAAIVDHLRPLTDTVSTVVTQHIVGTVWIRLDGDNADIATARSYTTVHIVRPAGGGTHEVVHRGLSYDDTLVRTAEGWRFAERFHQVLWSTTDPTRWPVPAYTAPGAAIPGDAAPADEAPADAAPTPD